MNDHGPLADHAVPVPLLDTVVFFTVIVIIPLRPGVGKVEFLIKKFAKKISNNTKNDYHITQKLIRSAPRLRFDS